MPEQGNLEAGHQIQKRLNKVGEIPKTLPKKGPKLNDKPDKAERAMDKTKEGEKREVKENMELEDSDNKKEKAMLDGLQKSNPKDRSNKMDSEGESRQADKPEYNEDDGQPPKKH